MMIIILCTFLNTFIIIIYLFVFINYTTLPVEMSCTVFS